MNYPTGVAGISLTNHALGTAGTSGGIFAADGHTWEDNLCLYRFDVRVHLTVFPEQTGMPYYSSKRYYFVVYDNADAEFIGCPVDVDENNSQRVYPSRDEAESSRASIEKEWQEALTTWNGLMKD